MRIYRIMLTNGHEVTVQADSLGQATDAALNEHPDEYVVAFKYAGEAETDMDDE